MIPATFVERLMSFLGKQRDYRGLRGVGQRWERLAEKRLKAEGYEIRARNYRASGGEIDFIAHEKGVLCFIEVKGRAGLRYGSPEEAVTEEKQRRITLAAEQYLQQLRLGSVPCRFDVVSIRDREGDPEITILRGAFEAGERR